MFIANLRLKESQEEKKRRVWKTLGFFKVITIFCLLG